MSDLQPNQNPYAPPPPGYPAPQQPGQMAYGQQQPYMPAPGAPGSMTGPLKVIGILYIVLGGLALLGGIVLPIAMTLAPGGMGSDRTTGLAIVYGFCVIILLIGCLEVACGYGLMRAKSWARTLGVVLACFSLLSVPLGTALGGYTLYILLKSGAKEEYEMLSNTARS